MQVNNEECKLKWNQFLEGDSDAYGWIYTAHIRALYAYGRHFTPDAELVKDCIQEVFTAIYKKRRTLLTPDNVKLYLFISLKNRLLNALCKKQLQTPDADPETLTFLVDTTAEDELIRHETRLIQQSEIRRILSILTPRQREIIYYRFVEELSYEEICRLMDLNYQSAHNLIQRSLKKIRENYDNPLLFILLLTLYLRQG